MQGLVGGPGVDTTVCDFCFYFILFSLFVRCCDLPDDEVALLRLRRG